MGVRWPLQEVLVLGSGGHLGQAICREFCAHGIVVHGVCRSRPLEHPGVWTVQADLQEVDAKGLLRLSGHVDTVIDAAAPYPVDLHPRDGMEGTLMRARRHAELMRQVVVEENVPVVHVGSIVSRAGGSDPTSIYIRKVHPYFRSKELIEEGLMEAARKGYPVVVLRATGCLGPWDTRPRSMCTVALAATGQLPVNVDRWVNLMDVRDLARVAYRAARQQSFGRAIDVLGHDVHMPELVGRVARMGGVAPPAVTIPSSAAVLGAATLETALAANGQRPAMPALGAMLVHESVLAGPAPARDLFGLERRPLDETLTDSLCWYRSIGYC